MWLYVHPMFMIENFASQTFLPSPSSVLPSSPIWDFLPSSPPLQTHLVRSGHSSTCFLEIFSQFKAFFFFLSTVRSRETYFLCFQLVLYVFVFGLSLKIYNQSHVSWGLFVTQKKTHCKLSSLVTIKRLQSYLSCTTLKFISVGWYPSTDHFFLPVVDRQH